MMELIGMQLFPSVEKKYSYSSEIKNRNKQLKVTVSIKTENVLH